MDHIVAAMVWKMYLLSNMAILGIHVSFPILFESLQIDIPISRVQPPAY